jgi:hypothetical protein
MTSRVQLRTAHHDLREARRRGCCSSDERLLPHGPDHSRLDATDHKFSNPKGQLTMKKGTTPRIGRITSRDAFDVLFGCTGGVALIATALLAFFSGAAEAAGPGALPVGPVNWQWALVPTAFDRP